MKNIRKLYSLHGLVFPFIFWLFFQCSKDPAGPVGVKFFERSDIGSEHHVSLFPISVVSFQVSTATGKSLSLFLGKTKTLSSVILIQFDTVSTTTSIQRAFLAFKFQRYSGNILSPVHFTCYGVHLEWQDSSTSLPTQLPSRSEWEPITTIEIPVTADTGSVLAEFPLAWAQNLIASHGGTNLLIESNQTDCLLKINSSEASSTSEAIPHLIVYTKNDTLLDTLKIYPKEDAFIPSWDYASDTQWLWVQNGIAWETYFYFDLSPIPPEASINRALLFLNEDTLLAIPNASATFYWTVYALRDTLSDFSSVKLDSSNTLTGSWTSASPSLRMTSMVQKWTSHQKPNCGFILKGTEEKENLMGRGFYSIGSDTVLAPKLDIYYSLPPGTRF